MRGNSSIMRDKHACHINFDSSDHRLKITCSIFIIGSHRPPRDPVGLELTLIDCKAQFKLYTYLKLPIPRQAYSVHQDMCRKRTNINCTPTPLPCKTNNIDHSISSTFHLLQSPRPCPAKCRFLPKSRRPPQMDRHPATPALFHWPDARDR